MRWMCAMEVGEVYTEDVEDKHLWREKNNIQRLVYYLPQTHSLFENQTVIPRVVVLRPT